ncbi:MAG: hypothetical protein ACRDRN_11840 [Sciscionella sp.]
MTATIFGAADRAYAFVPVAVQAAAYTAAANQLVPVDATAAARTVTLPAAPPDESVVCVKKVAGTNTVTVATGAGDVFNVAGGPTTWSLPLLYQGVIAQYSAAAAIWYILGDAGNGAVTGNFSASGNGSFGGTLTVNGKSTLDDQVTISSGNASGALFIFQSVPTSSQVGTIAHGESAAGTGAYGVFVNGDGHARMVWDSNGKFRWGPGNAGLDVSFERTASGILSVSTGSFSVTTAGQGLRVKEGGNAKQGVATLAAGTVTVANTAVTASSRIFLTIQSPGGTPGAVYVNAVTAGTSFVIKSTSVADTSVVGYEIFEPA